MLELIITAFIIATIFTILGSIIAILVKKENAKITSFFLAFASGSMLSICFIDLFPELIEMSQAKHFHFVWIILIIFAFFTVILLLHTLFDHCSHHRHDHECHVDEGHLVCHDRAHAYLFIENIEEQHNKRNLLHAGLVLFLAMCIHNFPEGISLGVTFALEKANATKYAFAILIGLHNIIVGISMAMPFLQAKMKKKFVILISLISSLPLLIGAICGYAFGNINLIALIIMLSFAVGAILYVVFTELLPQAYYLTKSKFISLFLILGVLVGALILFF